MQYFRTVVKPGFKRSHYSLLTSHPPSDLTKKGLFQPQSVSFRWRIFLSSSCHLVAKKIDKMKFFKEGNKYLTLPLEIVRILTQVIFEEPQLPSQMVRQRIGVLWALSWHTNSMPMPQRSRRCSGQFLVFSKSPAVNSTCRRPGSAYLFHMDPQSVLDFSFCLFITRQTGKLALTATGGSFMWTT